MKAAVVLAPVLVIALASAACGGGAASAGATKPGSAACQCTVIEKYLPEKNVTVRLLAWNRSDVVTFTFGYTKVGPAAGDGKRLGPLLLAIQNSHSGPENKSGPGRWLDLTLWANGQSQVGKASWQRGDKANGKVREFFEMPIPEVFTQELTKAGWISFQLKGSPQWKPPDAYVERALGFFAAMPGEN